MCFSIFIIKYRLEFRQFKIKVEIFSRQFENWTLLLDFGCFYVYSDEYCKKINIHFCFLVNISVFFLSLHYVSSFNIITMTTEEKKSDFGKL